MVLSLKLARNESGFVNIQLGDFNWNPDGVPRCVQFPVSTSTNLSLMAEGDGDGIISVFTNPKFIYKNFARTLLLLFKSQNPAL